MSFCIALLGARHTGKTTLAQALARGLEQAQVGPVVLVADLLSPRHPNPDEPPSLAECQAAAHTLTLATAQGMQTAGAQGWVVIDIPTPLGLPPFSLPTTPSLLLLMGLDLPPCATHTDQDNALRQALARQATPVHTIYGEGSDREQAAWQTLLGRLGSGHPAANAIKKIAAHAYSESARRIKSLQFKPMCENCGNAECEHRLFRQLIAGRC
ncbi:hypothetical protein [Hydrogenophaga soli]